ncbi:amidohydrolase family protein [Streptomyces sp. NPDC005917]|uniref:amidohydrolase family protein n=1 Tax=unclassified Streptomyces TaxID=2593676 RepID=UPI0033CED7DF
MVDVHAHLAGPGTFRGFSDVGWSQRRSSFPRWDLQDDAGVLEHLYGDREVTRIWMPQPQHGFDHRAANDYVRGHADSHRLPALCVLPDDLDYSLGQLRSGVYRAVKSYPHYREPPYQRILEFFPHEVLTLCEHLRLPLILHVPRPLSHCVEEVVDIMRAHPSLRVILAHAGRNTHADRPYVAALRSLSRWPNAVVDTAMVTSVPVLSAALRILGINRVLFGSDEPFNLLRYRMVRTKQHGDIAVPAHRYHWEKPWVRQRYGYLAAGAPAVHFQSLAAVFAAIDRQHHRASSIDTSVQKVFCANALDLLERE